MHVELKLEIQKFWSNMQNLSTISNWGNMEYNLKTLKSELFIHKYDGGYFFH